MFETDRLTVEVWKQPLSPSVDRRQIYAEFSPLLSPAVLNHLPEALQLSDTKDAIENWLKERVEESELLTIRDGDGTLIGLLILAHTSEQETLTTVHVGYLFSEAAWGLGYATELIAGLITCFRNKRRPVELVGGVETGNTASAKVLKKNGFERNANHSDPDTEMFRKLILPSQ
ncbi:GNAT family N-acetyltransferase [Ruegeria arenilitoris]|uniref:GNAT family N-acetyltransferase n=1 Tax=Ruegeria arenilitoris TaxID=1173585 RepID=UPI00147A1CAF|nr:GNAT family N-acetyltransferase [Ruegeria arenilitoris]